MNYISVEQVKKTWHDKPVLDGISFGIQQGEKVALVAGNGQGKSTLLQILAKKETPDSGVAIIRKDIRVGFLSQDPVLNDGLTIIENILKESGAVADAVKAYEKSVIEHEKVQNDSTNAALDRAMTMMNELDAWDYEHKVKQVLTQLQIHDFDQLAGSLSGGQRKRVALAQVLLSQPDLLIMDEPTNHLDLAMIEWLEGYLSQKDLTLLLVTHDRYFLDRVCDRILEIDRGKLYTYKGNYSYFVENKAHREMVAASELEKDKNLYRRELEWVRRMPKARTTKSKSRVEAFDDLESKVRSVTTKKEVNIKMRMERMGAKILEMHHLKKSFGDLLLVDDFSYVFKRGEKVGIVGKNGIGKSTFLNMIMGLEKQDEGKIVHGDTMIFGYYSQKGMRLEEGKKVIDVVRDVADYIMMEGGLKLTASQLLLQFGFHYDKQWDYVVKLSGGERRRLYLLTILMKAPNFLILDEPTNDLDIETLGVLEDFLMGYGGCLLIVSHDRYFMDKVVDHCFIFEGNGIIRDFPGNYSDYREWQELEEARLEQMGTVAGKALTNELSNSDPRNPVTLAVEDVSSSEVNSTSIVKRKLSFKEKFEFEQLEKEIADLEKEKVVLSEELQLLVSDYERISAIGDRLQIIADLLDEKGMRWLELAELME